MRIRNLFTVSLLLGMIGCGGGGGGDRIQFPGVYSVSLRLVSDPCGIADSLLDFVDEVNQSGSFIALRRGRLDYAGSINEAGDGFVVVNTFNSSNGCTVTSAIAYAESSSRDFEFGVGDVSDISCPGSALVCRITYAGTASKR